MLNGRAPTAARRQAVVFAADRSGLAAIEFAFIAPLAILLFFGVAQLGEAIVGSRHVNHTASSLGDLVTQCANVNDSDLSNIFAAGPDLIAPLPSALPSGASILGQRVTSVQVVDNNQTTQAQWSQASDSAGLTTAYAVNANVTIPNGMVTNKGDDIILAEVVYKYSFPVSAGGVLPLGAGKSASLSFGKAITFDNKTYYKPRKSAVVTYTGSGSGGTGSGTSCYAS